MVRRLWAFALVFVVAGASVASTMCQVTCTVHDRHAPSDHGSHHAHAAPPHAAAGTVVPATHTCDHQFDDTIAVRQTPQSFTAPAAVMAQAFSLQPGLKRVPVPRPVDIEKSPPGILGLTAQLRV